MSRKCDFCGKGTAFGRQYARRGVAKAKGGVGKKITGKTRRTFEPNLQSLRAMINGGVQRVKVCTQCIRSGKITKPLYYQTAPKKEEKKA